MYLENVGEHCTEYQRDHHARHYSSSCRKAPPVKAIDHGDYYYGKQCDEHRTADYGVNAFEIQWNNCFPHCKYSDYKGKQGAEACFSCGDYEQSAKYHSKNNLIIEPVVVYHCSGEYLAVPVADDDKCLVPLSKNLVIFTGACQHINGAAYNCSLEFSFEHFYGAALFACSDKSVINNL